MSSVQREIPLSSAKRQVSQEQRLSLLFESMEQQKERRIKRFSLILGTATLLLLSNALAIIYLA